MADSDSIEQDSEPTPFISRALIGRFLAVGLFVALGTFAVIQSISGSSEDSDKQSQTIAGIDADFSGPGSDGEATAIASSSLKSKPSTEFGSSNNVIKPNVVVSSSGFSPTAKPNVGSTASRQSNSGQTPAGFSFSSPSTSSKAATSSSHSLTAKPSTQMPTSLRASASATASPSQSPRLASNTSGFSLGNTATNAVRNSSQAIAETATTARRSLNALGSAAGTAASSAASATRQQFSDLKSSVSRSAEDMTAGANSLLQATKAEVEKTVDAGTELASGLAKKTSSTLSSPFPALASQKPAGPATDRPRRSTGLGQIFTAGSTISKPTSPFSTASTPSTATKPSSLNPSAVLRPVQSSTRSESRAGGLRSFADQRTGRLSSTADAKFESNSVSSSSSSSGSNHLSSNLRSDRSSRSPFGSSAKPQTGAAGSNAARPSSRNPFGNASTSVSTGTSSRLNRAGSNSVSTSVDSSPSNQRPDVSSPSPRLNGRRNGASSSLASSSSSSQINARLASSVSSRGMDTPGDRRLEGVQAPSLTIEKVSPREIQVNQAADFEIKVRNVGRVIANDVIVVDRVPSGTEFLGASPEPSKLDRGGDVQWMIGTIEPGQERRIRFQLRPTEPGEIGSVAHVLFATQASMRTVVTKPVLDIVHSARPRVLIGDNVVFDVVVENKGDGPATEVIVQEEVPDQLEYQEGFRQLEYEVGTLMPGQKRRIQLALRADKVGEFRNVVFVTGKGGLEAKHEIDVEVIAPEIRVTSEGPSKRFLQRRATHQFTIENRGTAEANNVNLVARLPGGLRYVSSDNRGRYDSNSHSVYWKMPSLKDGVAGTVELTTVPVEVGQQDIKFEANADLRLTAETTQAMSVEHLVDVYFEIDDVVDPIEVGTDTSYRLRILNQGTKVASNVQLQVEFPRGLEPTAVDGNLRNQIQGQQVAFEPITSLPPGQEVQVTIRARGNAPGDHRVVASIRSDGREVEISKEDTTRVYSDR